MPSLSRVNSILGHIRIIELRFLPRCTLHPLAAMVVYKQLFSELKGVSIGQIWGATSNNLPSLVIYVSSIRSSNQLCQGYSNLYLFLMFLEWILLKAPWQSAYKLLWLPLRGQVICSLFGFVLSLHNHYSCQRIFLLRYTSYMVLWPRLSVVVVRRSSLTYGRISLSLSASCYSIARPITPKLMAKQSDSINVLKLTSYVWWVIAISIGRLGWQWPSGARIPTITHPFRWPLWGFIRL